MGVFLNGSQVDLSAIQKVAPNGSPLIVAGTNKFEFGPIGYMIRFGIGFDPSPRKGVGGSPAGKQSWTIGVVQNVVSEIVKLEYDDGSVFQTTFPTPVLDSSAKFYKPFVYDLPDQSGPAAPGKRPLVDVTYTSKGYDELFDPFDPPVITNRPNFVDMVDRPSISAKLILASGGWIQKATHIVSFQVWLVATTPAGTLLIANVPPFSLVATCELIVPSGIARQIFSSPIASTFNSYTEAGIARTVNINSNGRTVTATEGGGGVTPVLTGTTANDRGEAWLRTNQLV